MQEVGEEQVACVGGEEDKCEGNKTCYIFRMGVSHYGTQVCILGS